MINWYAMQARLRELWLKYSPLPWRAERSPEDLASEWWKYHDPTRSNRAYHNAEHVAQCLTEFGSAKHLVANPDSVEMALWYHDIIYDPRRSDNEEQSAQFFVDRAFDARWPKGMINDVRDLILSTTHKMIPEWEAAKYIVDIDLSIFGQSEKVFDDYERKIRKEYERVSPADYIAGRSKILKSFLDRPHIYATVFFRAQYGGSARENLTRSVERLEKGIIL